MKTIRSILVFIALGRTSQASTLAVDSFESGAFEISSDGPISSTATINSPLGNDRLANLRPRTIPETSSITSTLDSLAGTLSASMSGPGSLPNRPLGLNLVYSNGPQSLLGANAFEFDFSALSGSGFLYVRFGGSETINDSNDNQVALTGPGTLRVDFNQANFVDGASLSGPGLTNFVFQSASENFSFTLDEIRTVPEPSSFLFVAFGGLLGLTRRRRAV